MADVVAVEQVGVLAQGLELPLQPVGDGRLARGRQAGEPQHAGLLADGPRPRGLADPDLLPDHVAGAVERETVRARADGGAVPMERPNQVFTRWYGFSLTFPNPEVFEE